MRRNIFAALLILIIVIAMAISLYPQTTDITIPPDPSIRSEEIIGPATTTIPTEVASSTNITTPQDMSLNLPEQSTSSEPITETPTSPTDTTQTISNLITMAWIYPSEPGCNASTEYRDGRKIDVLKPEFFTINGGTLILLDTTNSSCNGYSKNFILDLKRHSKEQYVTVSSASAADMETFLNTTLTTSNDIDTLVNFVVENNLTGIELDFEDFGGWSQQTYQKYLTFVEKLGTNLRAKDKKLMLDGPAIANSVEQNWFAWKYEDFTNLPVDHIILMAYDYQFDHGTGEPIAPLKWIKEVTTWASNRYPKDRLSVGIPSYGYEGLENKRPFIRTYDQLKNKTGFEKATRDTDSGEMTWRSGDNIYFYQDSESIRQKIKVVTDMGINSISVWHLGGNVWYE